MNDYVFDVVFLENDLYLNRAICQALNENGYRATSFQDWYEAVRQLRKNKTKILIFNELCYNINMMDYISFARTNLPETKIYLKKKKDIDSFQREVYYKKKINGILVKPFSVYDIICLLNE